MKTGYGFTKFENIKEFENWLNKLSVTRTITRLQVHHMYAPSYDNWKTDDALRRQNNIKSYHVNTLGWGDIAQHLSIFPDGTIVTGRSFNKTPIGIKGWNSYAVCVEIYGNFDKDVMTDAQRNTIIAVYALMCKKFKLTPSTSNIRYHSWFTAGGTYLGNYVSSKSAKSCPGLKFFGGNSQSAMTKNFIPAIKSYMNGSTIVVPSDPKPTTTVPSLKTPCIVKITTDELNIRKEANFDSKVVGTAKQGEAFTITECKNGLGKLKSGAGWISIYDNYIDLVDSIQANEPVGSKTTGKYIVRYLQETLNDCYKAGLDIDGSFGPKTQDVVKTHYLKQGSKGAHVIWLQKALINRGYKISADGSFGPDTLSALKKYQKSRKLTTDGYAGLATHKAIVND